MKTKTKTRIFKHPFLDAITKTSPTLILAVYLPIIFGLAYIGYRLNLVDTIWKGVGIYFVGLLMWSLFEYLLHRFLFHFVSESPRMKKFMYLMHGVHHDHPSDKERLFMPPPAGLILATILFLFFAIFTRWYIFFFFPGFLTGYLLYTFLHYSMHRYRPPKYFKKLWVHHALHHHQYPDKAFGVSSPLWDYVFGTMPPES